MEEGYCKGRECKDCREEYYNRGIYKYYNLIPPIKYLHAALSLAHTGNGKEMDFLLDKYFQSRNMPVCDALVKKMHNILQEALLHKK
jgi:hypothetical protein